MLQNLELLEIGQHITVVLIIKSGFSTDRASIDAAGSSHLVVVWKMKHIVQGRCRLFHKRSSKIE